MTSSNTQIRQLIEFSGGAQPAFWSLDWNQIESALRHRLPDDYKELCNSIPPGRFSDFMVMLHPLGSYNVNLLYADRELRSRQREIADIYADHALPHYARESPLFPCLLTDNDDVGFWLAEGNNPNNWTVVVNAGSGPTWWDTGASLSTLLHSHITADGLAFGPFGSAFEEDDTADFSSDFGELHNHERGEP